MTGEVILDSWWARCADQDSFAFAKTHDHGKFWNLSLLAGPSTWTGLVLALPPAVSLQTCSTPAAGRGQDQPSESDHTQATYTHTHTPCLYPHILFIILFGLCYVWILCIPVIAFAWRWNYKIRLIWVNKLALFSISPWYLFLRCMTFWLFFLNLNLLVSTNHVVCFWLYGCSSQKIRLNCYLFFFQSRRKSASGQQPCWFRGFTTEKLLSRIHYWLCMNTRRACSKPRWNVSHAPWWVAAARHKSHPWIKDSDQTKSLNDFGDYKMPLNSNVHHHLCSSSGAWIYLMTEKLQENVKVFIREAWCDSRTWVFQL